MSDKKVRGGKRSSSIINGKGDFGNGVAGTRMEIGSDVAGVKREFIGSSLKSFTYIDPATGATHTIRAHNAKEASQIASSAGYIKKRKKR